MMQVESPYISNRQTRSNNLKLWLTIILIVGALVRFHGIGQKSLWYDEFDSLHIATGQIERNSNMVKYSPLGVLPVLQNDVDVPLFYMLLNLWIRVFSNSEAALRSLPALFGIATIWLIYRVATTLLNQSIGLISALILALSPFHVYYAQEARGYTANAFFTLLTTYFFIRIVLTEEKKRSYWLGYLIAALLGIYTHYFTVLILAFQNLFLIFRRRDLFFSAQWLGGQVLLVAAWLLPFVTLFWVSSLAWVQTKSVFEPYWPYIAFPFVLGKFTFWDYTAEIANISRFAPALGILLFPTLFIFGLVGLLKSYGVGKTWLLMLWLSVPILVLTLVDLVEKTKVAMYGRYMIAASLAYYIILAAGIETLRNRYLKTAGLVFIVVLFSLALHQHYSAPKSEQWKEAAQYIDQTSPRPDLVISYPGSLRLINYYTAQPISEQVASLGGIVDTEIGKDFNVVLVMIKLTSPRATSADVDHIAEVIGAYYRLVEMRKWNGVKILKYVKK